MKKTMQLTIYSLPAEVERRYWTLVQTKASFFKRISTAEQRKLETLYEQLANAWNQNLTPMLLQDYETQLLKLENLSNEIKDGCLPYKREFEEKLKKRIKERSLRLQQVSSRLSQMLPTWKQDTLARLKKLEETKGIVTQFSEHSKMRALREQTELSAEEENLLRKRNELKLKSEQLKQLLTEKQSELSLASKQLALKKQPFLDSLQGLRIRNEEVLRKLRGNLSERSKSNGQEEAAYKERLKEKRQQLDSNLNRYELLLLTELRDAIKQEVPNFPVLLEDYWTQEDWSRIGVFIRNMQTEQGQLEKRLKTGLTKAGISFEEYMEAFDRKERKIL